MVVIISFLGIVVEIGIIFVCIRDIGTNVWNDIIEIEVVHINK